MSGRKPPKSSKNQALYCRRQSRALLDQIARREGRECLAEVLAIVIREAAERRGLSVAG